MLTNIVAGATVPALNIDTGAPIELIDPRTGESRGSTVNSTSSDVDHAMTAAADAFTRWRRSTPADRQHTLLKLADSIESDAAAFAEAEMRETGKPRDVVLSEEIPEAVSALRFFAGAARLLEASAAGEYAPGYTSFLRREPVGVCVQIAPWNYPLMMAVWKIGPALAAGNCVVLKPAETTPSTAVMLAEAAAEHLPPGVLNVVLGDRDTGRDLVAHSATELVSITGSTRAGIDVATTAAADLTRTHLELGGNAPLLVFEDVDVAETARGICDAAFYNAGQDCTAGSRVLVHESIHDDLVTELTAVAANTRTGTDEADFGPLNSAAQLTRVSGLVERLGGHAEIRTGGTRIGDRGFFFSPTVIAQVRQSDEIVQEEIFAPVITVQRFTDEAEAIALANDVRYDLASSVWTHDHARALRVSTELDFGCVWLNTHGPLVAEMPHGGFGRSGHGKDLSTYSFAEYTRIKHVMSRL